MRHLRTFVTFEAEFPDDAEWDEGENLVVPGGRTVATAIHDHLVTRGTSCTAPEQHGFYGWSFEVVRGSARIELVLQDAGPWLLIAVVRYSIVDRLFRRKRGGEASSFLSQLHDTLTADAVRSDGIPGRSMIADERSRARRGLMAEGPYRL